MFMHWRKLREPAHLPFLFVCVHWFAALNDVVTVYSGMFVVSGFVMRLSLSRRVYHLYTGLEHFRVTGHLLIFLLFRTRGRVAIVPIHHYSES